MPPTEVSLPHQIRGMAFDESNPAQRRLVAGFSTGEYGVIALPPFPNHEGRLPGGSPLPPATLGELFSPALPGLSTAPDATQGSAPTTPATKAKALGGLGSVMSLSSLSTGLGGLASLGSRKVDKNGVIAVPRSRYKGKELEGEESWLEGKAWGWEEDSVEGEVVVVRESKLVSEVHKRLTELTPDSRRHPDRALFVWPTPASASAQPDRHLLVVHHLRFSG